MVIMEIMATMVIMETMETMETMATMETTTIMVIILTSMLRQKLHSLVDLMEMAMGPTEMAARSHVKCANQFASPSA